MSLPTPKLDDRDWDDLVSEAKRRIAAKCPQWTDFNPSDPGMMLVELMAWMTETVFYRLNRVPEQNYIKFLELIGVRLQPARPARTWIFFRVQSGTKEEDLLKPILAGTPISTLPQRDRDPVTFTTMQDLVLTARKIIKTGSRYGTEAFNEREEIQNLCGETPWETDIFPSADSDLARGQAVPHHLYLGDPALGEFGAQNIVLRLLVEVENPMKGQLFLEWQACDGETWQTVVPKEDTTVGLRNNGTLVFEDLPPMKKCDLAQLEQVPASIRFNEHGDAFWLRARLIGSTMAELPTLLKVERRIDLRECTVRPLLAEAPAPRMLPQNLPYPSPITAPTPVETGTDRYPLGIKAETGSAFYLGSDLFQKHGATITIQFDLREVLRPKRIAIHWEYYSQDRDWKPLGISTQSGVATSQCKLQDGTNAFTRSGKVEFQCPEDVETIELGGQSGLFIRSRVEDAEFENDSDAKLVVKSIWLGFANEVRPWPFSLSKNYSEFKSHPPGVPFSPFRIEASRDPAFYLCFDDRPSTARGPYHLFLDVVPQKVDPDKTGMSWEYDAPNGWEWRPTEPPVKPQGAIIKWEYSAPAHQGPGWKPLDVQDGTEGFVHEGMLKFHCPRDWKETREFEQSGFWLRVRWEIAEFLHPPRLRRVQLNVAEAEQAIKQESVKLGSSTGLANQSFSLYTSILAYPEIWIRERGVDQEVSALEPIPNADVVKEADGYWVKWKEVRNFFGSQPDDRHFTVHLENGTFEFGDDQRGKIPPQGEENVFVSYRVTEGSAGNVGANTIIVLEKAPPQIQGVTNVHPAEGGYDRESIEKAKQRGPWEVKHRDRAVTEDDFIELAKKASPLVGRAECYGENGVIHIIIVPVDDGEKPHPSQRLIKDVRDYLEGRRLINACIKVRGPVYEAIDVEVEVVLDTRSVGDFSEVKRQIEESLRRFVHPLKGMDDGRGWPIGRTLHLSELYYRLEKLEGVDHVETLRICKRGTGDWGDRRIRIGSHSFPCFSTEMRIDQLFG